MTEKTTAAWLPLAAVACTLVFWASAFVAIRHLGHDFTPGSLSLGRLLVGSLCLAVVALSRGVVRPTRREWLPLVIIGLLWFGLYNVALNAGERMVDAGTAAMLIQVAPVLIALLAAVFLGERFTVTLGIGLALAFGGVALIAFSSPSIRATRRRQLHRRRAPLPGQCRRLRDQPGPAEAAGPAALRHPGHLAGLHDRSDQLPARSPATWSARRSEAPASSIWWLVYLGVFPTAIAFSTYAFALKHMSAGNLGVTTYLVPPITIVLGVIFLSEAPAPMAYAGGALALVGVAVARRKPRPGPAEPAQPEAAALHT